MIRIPSVRLAALALAAALGLAGPAMAQGFVAPTGRSIGTIPVAQVRVDVSRLVAQGWGENAGLMGSALREAVIQSLGANAGVRGGATIVVRPVHVFLGTFVGSSGGRFSRGGGGDSDYMQSETIVLDARGSEIARREILSALPSASGGAWYAPDVDKRRMVALARHHGAWVKTEVFGR